MCLALDLADTAHAGHFTDSVCMNLAAVFIRLKKRSTESYRCVFNTFLPHFDMHIYRFSHDKVHILKFRTLAFFFINIISKITNSGKNNYFLVFVILEHLP